MFEPYLGLAKHLMKEKSKYRFPRLLFMINLRYWQKWFSFSC